MVRIVAGNRAFASVAVLLLGMAAAGCDQMPAYIYKEHEFSRSNPEFGREPADIASVGICYNKGGSRPEEILAIAEARCNQYGKVARFNRQEFLRCSVGYPVLAHYDCVMPGSAGR